MATPERLALGLSMTMPARVASVAWAKRTGLSCAEVVQETRLALAASGMSPTDQDTRLAGWMAAIAAVYGRRALQFALIHLEEHTDAPA